MNDILSDLAVYSRRCANEARQHAERAAELKATDPTERHLGAPAKVEARLRDRHQAEVDQEDHQARTKSERARVAERGYLLARHDQELKDPEFTRAHGHLLARAHRAGLVTDSTD